MPAAYPFALGRLAILTMAGGGCFILRPSRIWSPGKATGSTSDKQQETNFTAPRKSALAVAAVQDDSYCIGL